MRTVSLLPAATEIVGVLGMMEQLVGVSHECDFPEAANAKPRVTSCEIHGTDVSSSHIDAWVSERLGKGEDLFMLDEQKFRELRPELILTQRLCDVCAPAHDSVVALAETLPGHPTVLNLEPSTLEDILQNIQLVADAMGVSEVGVRVIAALRERIEFVLRTAEMAATQPRVIVVEWLDPVFCSGHWTPQLVEIAGGIEVLGRKWEDSVRKSWDDVAASEPDILVLACCGQTAERAIQDWDRLKGRPEIRLLPAVRNGRVYAVDGNAYVSRPGPRIIDTLEIFAETIHPDLFAGKYPDRGVRKVK